MADFDFLTASPDAIATHLVEVSSKEPDVTPKDITGIKTILRVAKPFIAAYRDAHRDELLSGKMTQAQFLEGMSREVRDKLNHGTAWAAMKGVAALAEKPIEEVLTLATGIDDKGVLDTNNKSFKGFKSLVEKSPQLAGQTQLAQAPAPTLAPPPPEPAPPVADANPPRTATPAPITPAAPKTAPSFLASLNPVSPAAAATPPLANVDLSTRLAESTLAMYAFDKGDADAAKAHMTRAGYSPAIADKANLKKALAQSLASVSKEEIAKLTDITAEQLPDALDAKKEQFITDSHDYQLASPGNLFQATRKKADATVVPILATGTAVITPTAPDTGGKPASEPSHETDTTEPKPTAPAAAKEMSLSFSSALDAFNKMGDTEIPISMLMAQKAGVTHEAAEAIMGTMESKTLAQMLLSPEGQTLASPEELTQKIGGLFAHGIAEKTGNITKDDKGNDVVGAEEKLAGSIASERLRSWIDEAKKNGRIKEGMSAEDIHTLSAEAAKSVHAALVARKGELGTLGYNGAKGMMAKLGAMTGLSDDPIDAFSGVDENGSDAKNKYRYGINIESLTEAMLVSANGSEPAKTAYKEGAKKRETLDIANGVNSVSLIPGRVHAHANDRSEALRGAQLMTPAEEAAIAKMSQRVYSGEDVDTDDPDGKPKEAGIMSGLGKIWEKVCAFFTALMACFTTGGTLSENMQHAENQQHYKTTREQMLKMHPRELGYRDTEKVEALNRQWEEAVRTQRGGMSSPEALRLANDPELVKYREWLKEVVNKTFPQGGTLGTVEPGQEDHTRNSPPRDTRIMDAQNQDRAKEEACKVKLNATDALTPDCVQLASTAAVQNLIATGRH